MKSTTNDEPPLPPPGQMPPPLQMPPPAPPLPRHLQSPQLPPPPRPINVWVALRTCREERQMSLESLANLLMVDAKYLKAIEAGKAPTHAQREELYNLFPALTIYGDWASVHPPPTYGEALYQALKSKKWPITKLADLLALGRPGIGRVRNDRQAPSDEVHELICTVLPSMRNAPSSLATSIYMGPARAAFRAAKGKNKSTSTGETVQQESKYAFMNLTEFRNKLQGDQYRTATAAKRALSKMQELSAGDQVRGKYLIDEFFNAKHSKDEAVQPKLRPESPNRLLTLIAAIKESNARKEVLELLESADKENLPLAKLIAVLR